MTFKKNDFVEIDFTAKVKGGEVFDSNRKEDLKKTNLTLDPKPLVFSLGAGMFLKGVDDFLLGKNVGKYEIELAPENAFGNRNSKLVQIIPMRIFMQQNTRPVQGMMFNFDGRIAKILSVSGGRVIADFNNPVAGKTVIYDINVKRKIEDISEKAKSFIDFLFRKELKFDINDKKITLNVEKNLVEFVKLFSDKFKEILDLDLEVKEEQKAEKTEKKDKEEKGEVADLKKENRPSASDLKEEAQGHKH